MHQYTISISIYSYIQVDPITGREITPLDIEWVKKSKQMFQPFTGTSQDSII
jgi:hypothetical protein